MNKAQTLIRNFQKAVEMNAFAGSLPPNEGVEIGRRLEAARMELLNYIHELLFKEAEHEDLV